MARIFYPTTQHAGSQADAAEVLRCLALDMLSSDSGDPGEDRERTAGALLAVAFQLRPEYFNADAGARLADLAKRYKIFLPDWMVDEEEGKTAGAGSGAAVGSMDLLK